MRHRATFGGGPLLRFVLAGLALAAFPLPALAARIQMGDSSGGTPTPVDGSDLEVSFNPTVLVVTLPGETLQGVLSRLADGINEAGQGAYLAQVVPPASLDITRTTGGDIDDLRFRETDGGIQSVTLSLQRPRLAAWIGFVQQAPSAGAIVLTLNDQTIVVETTGRGGVEGLNQAIGEALRTSGFDVAYLPPYFVVRRNVGNGESMTRVGWRSTDPAITASDLALLPEISTDTDPGATGGSGSAPTGDRKRRLKP